MNEIGPISSSGPKAFGNSQQMHDRLMAKVDADQNGNLSFEEIEATDRGAQIADKLRAFDTDESGDLSIEELTKIQEHVAEKIRDKVQASMPSSAMPEALFDALYADKDD
ncbi:MAG: hypothetical protein AAGM21_09745 [Pseudomonadota bacterium]